VTVTVPEASLNLNIGPDFFKADREANGTAGGREGSVKEEEKRDADGDAKMEDVHGGADADADGEADDAASLGSLFDDDAEGEEEGDVPMADPTPTPAPTVPTPVPAPAPFLALPGASKPTPPTPSVPTPAKPAAKPFSAAPTIPRPAPSRGMPFLTPTEFQGLSPDVLLTAAMTGQVTLLDRRVGGAIGRLQPGDKAPPWCMSVSLAIALKGPGPTVSLC
jgi:transcriptional activator SPT8